MLDHAYRKLFESQLLWKPTFLKRSLENSGVRVICEQSIFRGIFHSQSFCDLEVGRQGHRTLPLNRFVADTMGGLIFRLSTSTLIDRFKVVIQKVQSSRLGCLGCGGNS